MNDQVITKVGPICKWYLSGLISPVLAFLLKFLVVCCQGTSPVQWQNYQTRHEAQQDVLNYISMFYNSCRLHSSLGYSSPNDFECEGLGLRKVA